MSGGAPIAVLSMYDWPQVRGHTDRLWAAVRDNLTDLGVAAPQELSRPDDVMAAWRSPALVFGQTCGLPYVEHLRGQVTLVATPDYDVPDCRPGWYRSAVIARHDDSRDGLAAFRGARLAINGKNSQSGWQAMLQVLDDADCRRPFFGELVVSGAHANSVKMVADGAVDVAAIDYVSWRLARAHLAEAQALRIVTLTRPMPGLPFITQAAQHRDAIVAATAAAIDDLPAETRDALGIRGLWRSDAGDYEIVAEERRD